MSERPEFFTSLEAAHKAIDASITVLDSWKKGITESNYNEFSLSLNENRDLEPVRTKNGVIGFRQMSPIVLCVTVEDSSLLGKELIPNNKEHTPWSCPTSKEIAAVDEQLKEMKGRYKKYMDSKKRTRKTK